MIDEETIARFWARVDKSRGPVGCWFYTIRGDYGRSARMVRVYISTTVAITRGRNMVAARLAYTLAYGDIPKGKIVRHRCGYGGCVNPAHLTTGTHRENTLDMYARSRNGITNPAILFTYESEAQP